MIGAILGTAGSIGSAIWGGIASARAAKKAKGIIDQQLADNQTWYERNYNADATQRADAQRILQLTQDNIRNRNNEARGVAAVGGGTEESLAATKAANAKAMADTASQIASSADTRKDSIEDTYLTQKNTLQGQQVAIENNRAANIAKATQGAATALGQLGLDADDTDLAGRIDKKIGLVKEG